MDESFGYGMADGVDAGETDRLRNHVFNLKLRVYYLEEQLSQVRKDDKDGQASSRISKENVNLKVALDEKTRELEERNMLLRRARSAIENLQNEVQLRNADLEEAKTAPQRERQRLKAELEAATASSTRWKTAAEEAHTMCRELQDKLKAAEDQAARVAPLEVELEYTQGRVEELREQLSDKGSTVEALRRAADRATHLEAELKEANSTISRCNATIATLEVKVSEATSHSSMSESEHRSLVASLREEIAAEQRRREAAEDEVQVKSQLLDEADRAIKELEDRVDGQGETIRSLTASLREAEARVHAMEDEHTRFAESATSFKDEANSRLEFSRRREKEMADELVKVQAKVKYMEETIAELRARESEYKQEMRKKEETLTEVRQELNQSVEKTRELSREVLSVQRLRDSAIAEATANARADLNSSIAEVKAEAMELHQTMQQQKEHYREQQEKLLEQVRHWYAHVKTVLVDFMKPPQWPKDLWAQHNDAYKSDSDEELEYSGAGFGHSRGRRRSIDASDAQRRKTKRRGSVPRGISARDSVELTVEEPRRSVHRSSASHSTDGEERSYEESLGEWRPEPEVVRLLERLPRVKVWFEETAQQCVRTALNQFEAAAAHIEQLEGRLKAAEANVGPASAAAKAFAAARQRDSETSKLLSDYQRVAARAERLESELKHLTQALEESEQEHRASKASLEETRLLAAELEDKKKQIEALQARVREVEGEKHELQRSQRSLRKQVKERDEQITLYMSRLERHLSSLGSTVPSPLAKQRSRTVRIVLDEAAKHLDRAKGLARDVGDLLHRSEDMLRMSESSSAYSKKLHDLFGANASLARALDVLASRLTASFASFPDIVRAVNGTSPGWGNSLVSPTPVAMPSASQHDWAAATSPVPRPLTASSAPQETRRSPGLERQRSRGSSHGYAVSPDYSTTMLHSRPQAKVESSTRTGRQLSSSRSESAVIGNRRRSSSASSGSLTRSRLKEVHSDMVERLSNIGVALQDTAQRLTTIN